MNDIEINRIKSVREIHNSLLICSDSLFNQDINNEESLCKLSRKYAEFGVCFNICIESTIAAFVACYVNDSINKVGFLSIIVVRKGFQGLGLGSLLLDLVITMCKNNSITELRLEVDTVNTKAIQFYQKRGFQQKNNKANGMLTLFKIIK